MSAIEERSPKRQRTSYSPASPPLQEVKQLPQEQTLHTPPPSVHMSPSWQTQSVPSNTAGDSTIPPTPSSTNANYSQAIKGDSEMNSGQTPRDEVADDRETEGDVKMNDAEHRRTDHERITGIAKDAAPVTPTLYKVSTEPVTLLPPDPSSDLLSLYSLKAVQASVARRDPRTGEKINKLRKSYETKSRNLGVEGRNKATVQEGHLQGLVDPLWDSLVSDGLTMWDQKMENVSMGGSSADELLAALDKSLHLRPGRLPRAEYADWRQQLGLDDTVALKPGQASSPPPPKAGDKSTLSATAPSSIARASAPSSPNGSSRPDRAGKKRRYDESSYEGYDDDGYSTGGIDGRSNGARRVKRKVTGF